MPPAAPQPSVVPAPDGNAAQSVDPVIEVHAVVKDYPAASGAVRALDHVTLRVVAGELVAIVGKSNCGKLPLLVVHMADGRVLDAGPGGRGVTDG